MFTGDGLTFLRFFLNKCWTFFSINVPATNITFAQLLFGILLTSFVIKLVMKIFDIVPSTGERLTNNSRGSKNDR